MATNNPLKPSPLSFTPPRASPFRRPESPRTPGTVRANSPAAFGSRPTTPTTSPLKNSTLSRDNSDNSLSDVPTSPSRATGDRSTANIMTTVIQDSPKTTPQRLGSNVNLRASQIQSGVQAVTQSPLTRSSKDPVASLPPAQLRNMRESFQVLDSNSTGTIDSADVANTLASLGLENNPSALGAFFPPSSGLGKMNLTTYLNNLASLLQPLSSQDELMAAFGAFDVDDSGQIDVDELKEALLHEGMSGREVEMALDGYCAKRAFGKGLGTGGKRGDVFKYRDFVAGIMGAEEKTPVVSQA